MNKVDQKPIASPHDVIEAIKRFDPVEIEQVYRHLTRLRAMKPVDEEMRVEAELLKTILKRRSREFQRRFRTLMERKRVEKMSGEDIKELITLTDEAELFNARRIEALGKLAQMRRTTIPQLMEELGIKPVTSE